MTAADARQIAVLGGGAFGTALAGTLARAGRDVVLWARDTQVVAEITQARTNTAYLPGVMLDARLRATTDLPAAVARDVVLLVTPAQQTRAVATQIAGALRPGTPVVLCAKGLEQATGCLLTEVLADVLPQALPLVLSGPSFAQDIVRGLPAALTLAATDGDRARDLATLLGDRLFRLYASDDPVGVQLGGAVKNVLAIAAGIIDGRGLGASAHAALVTRGFAELRRFAESRGARSATLMGLSGLGDLLLTCSSPQSRNMSLGRALGAGGTLPDSLGRRGSTTEGVMTAAVVAKLARASDLDMPIAMAVAAVLADELTVDAAIATLLSRPFKSED
jgi:glycerol-3-phosphate dehydrogenase (NAD(P)+)